MPLMMLMPLPRAEAKTEAPTLITTKIPPEARFQKSGFKKAVSKKKAIYNAGANGYNIRVPILLTKEKARR
jgi:hypothetical protein